MNTRTMMSLCLLCAGALGTTVWGDEQLPDDAVGKVNFTASQDMNVRVEQILRENAPTNRSLDACAIVYRVANGKQIAAVSLGDVGPNTAFEPGSVIKPLTLVAAMEEGVAKIDTEYSTNRDDPKYFRLPGDGGHAWPETMTVADGVVRSSNIVLAKLGVDVGVTNLLQTFHAFGIGTQGGQLPSLGRISRVMESRMGIGQCLLATPDEIARAYVILANRGRSPWTGTRVVSAPTAEAVSEALRRVVSMQGTAWRAKVEGVEVVGKTGTAQRCIDGKYGDEYQASFVGYFPAEKPQYLVLVTYRTKRDGDQFHQGGRHPAQAFRQIASFMMMHEH